MKQKLTVKRMIRAAQSLPMLSDSDSQIDSLANEAHATAQTEPRELAREMHRAVADELERFRKAGEELSNRHDPRKPPPDCQLEAIRDAPDEDIRFFELQRLASFDPKLMTDRWNKMTQAAGESFANGWFSARALEFMGGDAWERACFLAIRRGLRQAWAPRNQGEALLIDQLTQYELIRQKWIGILSLKSRNPATITAMESKFGPSDNQRKISAIDATLEAVKMVERLDRLFQKTLKTLMSLRSAKAPVIYGSIGQVNVAAGPQVNVQLSRTEPSEPPENDESSTSDDLIT